MLVQLFFRGRRVLVCGGFLGKAKASLSLTLPDGESLLHKTYCRCRSIGAAGGATSSRLTNRDYFYPEQGTTFGLLKLTGNQGHFIL